MRPHNPMLDTYQELTAELVQTMTPILRSPSNSGGPTAPVEARNLWPTIPTLLEQIKKDLWTLGEQILRISTDSRFTDQAKADEINQMAVAVRQRVDSATRDALARAEQIIEISKAAAYPARPTPHDATQEAALAGFKGDLRMVWDRVATQDLQEAMRRSLGRALADGDTLGAWLLASSHWPEDYLESRGENERRDSWPDVAAAELDAGNPASLADARRAYRIVSDGRDGLPLLKVLFNQLVPIMNDLAQWRPSIYAPVPPTHV